MSRWPWWRNAAQPFDIAPDNRESSQLSFSLWLGTSLFMLAGGVMSGNVRYSGEYLSIATGLTSACFFAWLMYLGFRRLAQRPRWLAYLALPVLIVLASVAQTAADFGGYFVIKALLPRTRLPEHELFNLFQASAIYACLYATNIGLIWVTSANRAMREQSIRLNLVETQRLRAELQTQRLKLNPHFMFNALGAAMGLYASGRAGQGEAMLNRLSIFLRTSYDVGTDDVALADELSIVDDYLEVERVRFPDRMIISVELDEQLRDVLVPSLLLQPLVENAVKYGVAASEEPVTITIRAQAQADRLVLTVENDCHDSSDGVPHGTGVGQEVTRTRLALRFAEAGSFSAAREGDIYRVVLGMPLARPPAPAPSRPA